MGTRDHIRIHGIPVRIHGDFEREVTDETGAPVTELEVAIIIRGRLPNKQFLQLLSQEPIRIDLPDSAAVTTMFTRIGNHSAVASGSGEGTVYRHDILFREMPDSYQRRRAEKAALQAAMPEPEPVRRSTPVEPEPVEHVSQVLVNADPSGWGEAIRQLRTGAPRQAAPVEDPLTMAELTAIETVLTNLRIDALIDQLCAAGLIRREAIDERFRALVEQRFIAEAIPLIGEKAARRALREI